MPGAAVWFVVCQSDLVALPALDDLGLEKVSGVTYLAGFIGAAFATGVLVHGVQRLLKLLSGKLVKFVCRGRSGGGSGSTEKAWYQAFGAKERFELAAYFWYMRATCWNLGIACGINALLVVLLSKGSGASFGAMFDHPRICMVANCVLLAGLCALGYDYDRALNKAKTGAD